MKILSVFILMWFYYNHFLNIIISSSSNSISNAYVHFGGGRHVVFIVNNTI